MKTLILILSVTAMSLVSCKEETKTGIQTNSTNMRVDSKKNTVPLHFEIKPFGYNLNGTHINYLGFKRKGDGC